MIVGRSSIIVFFFYFLILLLLWCGDDDDVLFEFLNVARVGVSCQLSESSRKFKISK